MKPLRYKRRDWIAYGVLLAYLAAAIVMGVVLSGKEAVWKGVCARV